MAGFFSLGVGRVNFFRGFFNGGRSGILNNSGTGCEEDHQENRYHELAHIGSFPDIQAEAQMILESLP